MRNNNMDIEVEEELELFDNSISNISVHSISKQKKSKINDTNSFSNKVGKATAITKPISKKKTKTTFISSSNETEENTSTKLIPNHKKKIGTGTVDHGISTRSRNKIKSLGRSSSKNFQNIIQIAKNSSKIASKKD